MTPFGDRALRFAIPAGAPRRRLQRELAAVPRVVDVVLTEDIGCVYFAEEITSRDELRRVLEGCVASSEDERGAVHVVETVYDGEDLDAVAHALGRTRDDVIALHAGGEYRVAMLGFLPGFAYLQGLPTELRLPRRAPRPRVPPGSVAIAAEYTGIYPFASPGGWHLVGRAPSFLPFDVSAGRATFALGDTVRFVRAEVAPTARVVDTPAMPTPIGPHLEITRAAGLALLVDAGRAGRKHDGIPPGGPLVRSAMARANVFAGNEAGACAIELVGAFEVTARGGPLLLGDDVLGTVRLQEGERHVVSTDGRVRVRYLGLAGGIDAPLVLGGRGALLVAGIGGPLRRGAKLAPLSAPPLATSAPGTAVPAPCVETAPLDLDEPIAIVPGPDADDLDAIVRAELRISPASDRTGTRLEGALPEAPPAGMARRSTPMTIGAIERTPSGLVVLGPDHPTTGGYPVVAVVRSSSLDRFMARPVGATVRFRVS